MMRESMSRPSSSVPSQCAAEGPERRSGRLIAAGSWGAIQGAKMASTVKITTRTIPAAASGFRPMARRKRCAAGAVAGMPEGVVATVAMS